MARLSSLRQLRCLRLTGRAPARTRTLWTGRSPRIPSNLCNLAARYGTPFLFASVAAGVLSSRYATPNGSTSGSSARHVHLEAPNSSTSWFGVPTTTAQRQQKRGVTTSASDAEKEIQEQASESKSGDQAPPPQSRVAKDDKEEQTKAEAGGQGSVWSGVTDTVASAGKTVSALPNTIVDYVIPDWFKDLPVYWTKLQREMSMAPGSLAEEIWREANDPEINEEILWEASVRVSEELCADEKRFLEKRQAFTRRSLAKYLGIPEEDIHPEDVPVIAMCGSGGGLRALVAGSSSYLSTKEVGLFDCVTYTAGVSGSCWLQTLYYSSITGCSHERLIRHLKNRLGVHIAFPPDALALLASAPTDKYLLNGLVEKAKGIPDADFGIVHIYGLLLAARLLVPKAVLSVDEHDFKLSNQRRFVDNGANPLPIYTAVRHEIPIEETADMKDPVIAQAKAKKEAWFQWFEFTPYEFWCEEFGAGVPTWAIGRKFENGRTVWRENGLSLPELRIPLLMGIWGSAFCATMSHYYREVRPALTGGLIGWAGLDEMISGRDDDLIKMHPIDPAGIPNFVFGMKDFLPASVPDGVIQTPNLQLMDAGMSNNLPIYPLLRPGRNVDIIIAFDASADVKTDNWLKEADGYARQRGIKGWPIGAGWPDETETPEEIQQELDQAQAKTEDEAQEKMHEATKKEEKRGSTYKDLGYCNIWVGTTEERTSDTEPPSSKLVEEDWELMEPHAGITVIYFPFMSNPKVEGVDPKTSDFMSTWNFVYTPDQVDKVVELARTNFQEGEERTKRTVKAVYERKKRVREQREEAERERRRRWLLRRGQRLDREEGEADHGDQFS